MLATWGCTTFPKPTLSLDFLGATSLDSGITFSRGSQATLFDSTGTLVYAKHNLFQQSQTIATAPWGASVGGTGGITVTPTNNEGIAPDGTNTATRVRLGLSGGTTTSDFAWWRQNHTGVSGLPYTTSFWAKSYDGTSTYTAQIISVANTVATITITGTWTRFTVTANGTGTSNAPGVRLRGGQTPTNSDSIDILIWGAQLNIANMEGGVTSSLTTYYPTTTAAYYAPRFDYNPSTLQPRGLLIEEQRTNLIRNSTGVGAVAGTPGTAPTNWVVGSSATHASSIIGTGVENGINYVDIQYVVSAGAVAASLIYADTPAATASTAYTGSYFLKLVSGSIPQVRFIWQDGITTVARSFFSITSSLTRYDNTYTTSVGATLARFVIGIDASAAGTTFVIRVGLPQTEQGAFATSVIPTTTTALTRNADVATMTGTNFSSWYNASEGTLFAQFMRTASANTQQGRVFSLSDGSNVRVIEIYQTGATNPAAQIGDSGSQAQWTPTGFTVGLPIKEILAYKLNDSNASFNGSAETPDTVCTIPTVNQAQIGNRWDGLRNLNGYVQRLAYYPTRLPNTTLQALTA